MNQCSMVLFSERLPYNFWTHHRCACKATVVRKGKEYCTQHDPVQVAEKHAKRDAKWAAESKVRNETWRWEKAAKAFCAQVSAEELERLVLENRPLHTILSEGKL